MKKLLFLFTISCLSCLFTNAQVNLLQGSDMENASAWQIATLNTPENNTDFTASWGETTTLPSAGTGGALRVKGKMSTSGNVQYCIYQSVTLEAGIPYAFDAAYTYRGIDRSWVEAFIGEAPINGEDYTDALGTKIANFGGWDIPLAPKDGTIQGNTPPYTGVFTPTETKNYYFVVKMGSTTWDDVRPEFDITIDNLSLSISRPIVNFSVTPFVGFAGVTQFQFTDKSDTTPAIAPNAWSWNFGDTNTSTTQNPTHTYATTGKYSVALTASKESTSSTKTSPDLITIYPFEQLTGGGKLVGGSMDKAADWTTSFLNTPEAIRPSATWNYTKKKTAAGNAGSLFIDNISVADQSADANSQICIYQKVTLSKEHVYSFDGAFRDLTDHEAGLHNFWIEVFIGTQPIEGEDYTDANGKKIANISAWNAWTHFAGADLTFKNLTNITQYTPPADADYYLVIKMGTWGNLEGYSFLLDELSLTETRTKPVAAFTSDITSGFIPSVTVQFKNESAFATSYEWTFGDGTTSTDKDPIHTFNGKGSYAVTLKAINEVGDITLEKKNYITVAERPQLPEGHVLYGDMEISAFWKDIPLNRVGTPELQFNYKDDQPTNGAGGCFRFYSQNMKHLNWSIVQEIQLKKDYQYTLDGLYKTEGIFNTWVEFYISKKLPEANNDYGTKDGTMIAKIDSWNGAAGTGPADGKISTVSLANDYKNFVSPDDASYYLIIKMGNWDGSNMDFMLDELTLIGTLVAKADFTTFDATTGDAPLSVGFFDMSDNSVTSWTWDFGDGNTSTEQHPTHIYTTPGTYTVSLTVGNGITTDTKTETDFIVVSGQTSITDLTSSTTLRLHCQNGTLYLSDSDLNPLTITIYNLNGETLINQQIKSSINVSHLSKGIYLVRDNHGRTGKFIR